MTEGIAVALVLTTEVAFVLGVFAALRMLHLKIVLFSTDRPRKSKRTSRVTVIDLRPVRVA